MRSAILALGLTLGFVGTASAAHHHRHHGGFNCGLTQMRYFGLHDSSLALALNWNRFPTTYPHPGAVVVQRRAGRALGGGPGGHVSHIVSVMTPCRAIVSDSHGTYARDICSHGAHIVQPS